jgi:hypothetical protein
MEMERTRRECIPQNQGYSPSKHLNQERENTLFAMWEDSCINIGEGLLPTPDIIMNSFEILLLVDYTLTLNTTNSPTLL